MTSGCTILLFVFFLMIRRPPRSTRTDTLCPYTTLFRSGGVRRRWPQPDRHPVHGGLHQQMVSGGRGDRRWPLVDRGDHPRQLAAGGDLRLEGRRSRLFPGAAGRPHIREAPLSMLIPTWRSEEHTSELQSLMRISYAVFCLKKKKS